MLAIFFSLGFYGVMTWLTQSIWLFKVSPKTFPFLCEPPAGTGQWGGPQSEHPL